MRPVVLVPIGRYLPGSKAGGPIRSVANIVAALGDEFDFRILTLDRDLGDDAPYPGIEPGVWTGVGRASVRYLTPDEFSPRAISRAVAEIRPDLVYAQSYFAWTPSVVPRLLKRAGRLKMPLLVTVHGEFSPGALAQRPAKKRRFLTASRLLGLDRGVLFHATAPHETEEIRRTLGPRAEVFEAGAIPTPSPPAPTPREKRPGDLEVVFVSRISPKKNLLGAIELLKGVGGAHLTVYGPKEDAAYWERCLAAARESNVAMSHGGTLEPTEVVPAFGRGHVFLFPTLGENYGHAIMESLQAGTPVIISDPTPWRGLREAGVGWDLPLDDASGFRDALKTMLAMDGTEFAAISARAWAYARARSEDPAATEANRALLRWAIHKDATVSRTSK